ncbi:MAG: zinc-ribbon domain-containing protein [Candidatus Magnetomorum sp.]|nr:zinc-ribbon domain-containing protein [Candidatus Magnetomorum sp.]
MIVHCEKCQKKYRIDDNRIPEKGLNVRCSHCKHIFSIKRSKKTTDLASVEQKTPDKKNISAVNDNSAPDMDHTETLKPVKTEITNLPEFAEWDDDIVIVNLPGDTLDAANCQDFKDATHSILETPNKVIFNMENIQFVDSSGCGTLNACIKRIKKHGGDIKICNVLDQVGAIFRLIKLNRVFHICDTREDAIQAFSGK